MSEEPRSKGRQPDFNLSALDKDTGKKGKVGAAWKNADGTISISLNNFVVLSAQQPLVLTLFPNTPYETSRPVPARSNRSEALDDDIPF